MIQAAAAPVASSVVPGVLGFLVVAAMGLALFFLLRSLNKQLHKVVGGPPWREKTPPAQSNDQDARPGASARP